MTYTCPAARNFALGRWECPVPVSPACNANCIGCISFQPEDETIVSTQDRLTFKPSPEEIRAKMLRDQEYVLSKIRFYQAESQNLFTPVKNTNNALRTLL